MQRLHDVNFFIKLIAAFVVMALAWLMPDWRYGVPFTIIVLLFMAGAKVPGFRAYLKGVALLTLLVMASWLLNLTLQGLSLIESLPIAIAMAARLVTTTAAFFFVMETSTPGSILAACSSMRLPPIATLTLSLVFGIIPMLREDFERIADAQRARGMEIDDVPLPVRLKFALARGVPLLVHAIRMAHAISLSLSIYGFDLKRKRTTWRNVGLLVEPSLKPKDIRP